MKSKLSGLSIFFPFYNEEGNVERVVRDATVVAEKVADAFEIIMVDDGSQDKTGAIVDRLAKSDSRLRAIHHPVNKGYGAALKSGFYASKYDYIVFNDGDGQFDFSEIVRFLDKIDKADFVIGYRKKRSEGTLRIINQKLYHALILFLFGVHYKDLDCAFKLMKKQVLDSIDHLQADGALISVELLMKARRKGFRITEIPVTHYPRVTGRPTGANPAVIMKMFKEVFRFYHRLNERERNGRS